MSPWKAWSQYTSLLPAGRRPGQLDPGLHRFRPRVAEEHALLPWRVREQTFAKQPREQRDVHLHQIRQVRPQHVDQRLLDHRMIAAHREHAKPGQQIEIAGARLIVEVRTLGAYVVTIEADRPEHADHLRIEVPVVQREALAGPFGQLALDVERHLQGCSGNRGAFVSEA